MRLLVLLALLFAFANAVYVPPHVPVEEVVPGATYQVPYWLGMLISTTNQPSTWTLPLVYFDGGVTPNGATLIVQNNGPYDITLVPTSPETIAGTSSYLVSVGSTVSLLSSADWVVTSAGAGTAVVQNQTVNCWLSVGTSSSTNPQCGDFSVSGSSLVYTWVQHYGAVGDGVTDDTVAIISAFQTGGNIYFPPGNYNIAYVGSDSGGAYVTINKSIRVLCHRDAKIMTAPPGVDNDLIRLTVPINGTGLPAQGIDIIIDGCTFDQTNQRGSISMPMIDTYPPLNPGNSSTCDALSIRGDYILNGSAYSGMRLVHISNCIFHAGPHWEVAGGDAGIFAGAGTNLTVIEANVFTSHRDSSIYASWDSVGAAGGSIQLVRNTFTNSFFGITIKRSAQGFTVDGNNFYNNVGAISTNVVVGSGDKGGSITSNFFNACLRNVRMDSTSFVSVKNNHHNILGNRLYNGTAFVSYSITGYLLSGSTYNVLVDNSGAGLDPLYVSASPLAITLEALSGVNSSYNEIRHNRFTDLYGTGVETIGQADFNRIEGNYAQGGTVPFFQVNGPSSTNFRYEPDSGLLTYQTPLAFADSDVTRPLIRRFGQSDVGLYMSANKIGIVAGTSLGGLECTNNVCNSFRPHLVVAGTSGAPSLAWNAESTLGFYRPATGTGAFTGKFWLAKYGCVGCTAAPVQTTDGDWTATRVFQGTNQVTDTLSCTGLTCTKSAGTYTMVTSMVSGTPSSSSAPCSTGAYEFDANFMYICVSTNSWRRLALSTF